MQDHFPHFANHHICLLNKININVESNKDCCHNLDMGLDILKMKRLREDAGLDQLQAAKLAGMKSRQAWSRIESGAHTNVSIETLESIAAALGVKAKDLLK